MQMPTHGKADTYADSTKSPSGGATTNSDGDEDKHDGEPSGEYAIAASDDNRCGDDKQTNTRRRHHDEMKTNSDMMMTVMNEEQLGSNLHWVGVMQRSLSRNCHGDEQKDP
ncbi:unnamed protein product [Phytophthora fragariaefolia]|uniref:Unnamed protein product n=1 Tax=Phytophthora fragariaefolia TaxID=1490495 RepID=A0A9W6X7E3_9STRA|nr:unnamed protein product [Phytophthora fragariaefolia]